MHIASRSVHAPRRGALFVLVSLALYGGSCKSAATQRADADREVYAIVEKRRAELASNERTFTIEPNPDSLRRKLERGEVENLAPLTLAQCLDIAAENSRDFQDQRETFYLSALDLTLERYRFAYQESGLMGALLSGDGDGATDASGDATFGLTKLLGTGATIVGNIGLSVARDLTQADAFKMITNAGLAITQPLLAGSNPRIVREPLTQAERNVVYSARNYERFRRTYAVDVSRRVYRILQQADAVVNEEKNYANLQILRKRNEALGESGRLSSIDVDQARQQELGSRNRLVILRQSYESLLHDFKIFLGLPVPVPLAIDYAELERLTAVEPEAFDLDVAKLDEIALAQRLDFQTVLDRRDDSERGAEVDADALRSRLAISSSVNATSLSGRPLDVRASGIDWQLGLNADIALDRFPERNRYRQSLIQVESARRDVEAQGDSIRAEIRNDLGDTAATLEGYKIQRLSVAVAERRVESSAMNLQAGRATTRDVLESQLALLNSKNSATQALIDYQLARLALFLDLELLRIDETGIGLDREALLAAAATPEPDAQPDVPPQPGQNPPEQRP